MASCSIGGEDRNRGRCRKAHLLNITAMKVVLDEYGLSRKLWLIHGWCLWECMTLLIRQKILRFSFF